jgi:hypothetical protein
MIPILKVAKGGVYVVIVHQHCRHGGCDYTSMLLHLEMCWWRVYAYMCSDPGRLLSRMICPGLSLTHLMHETTFRRACAERMNPFCSR